MPADGHRFLNALTVDVEDWVQSVFDPALSLTDCFIHNTRRVLEHLEEHGVRATFFVLGLAAEKAPDLVRKIHSTGHEVQSHGYGHRLIHTQTPAQFREDLLRSKGLLEDLIGRRVIGYRAPAFSITGDTLWALDILADCGFEYDSSVFPIAMRRYGIHCVPRFPHSILLGGGRSLIELPVGSCEVLGRRWPMGGGGYFRLFPYGVIRRGIRQINGCAQPAILYMHPYEYSPQEIARLPVRVPWRLRWHQSIGRRGLRNKIDRMLRDFEFATLGDVVRTLGALPSHDYLADRGRAHPAEYRAARLAGGA